MCRTHLHITIPALVRSEVYGMWVKWWWYFMGRGHRMFCRQIDNDTQRYHRPH